jgi:hypothetical protein
MTDLSTIRVIPFYGKSEEWPTLSERFLAKARRYGFKDVLLGRLRFQGLMKIMIWSQRKERS